MGVFSYCAHARRTTPSREINLAEFFDEFRSIQAAYESRALDLLRSKYSQTYIALFRCAFPDKTESRYEDDLLLTIEHMIDDLSQANMQDALPVTEGRTYTPQELCRKLTDDFRWLESNIEEDGRTTYRLTTDAMRAMDAIDSLSRADAIFSGSLMRVLREALTRTAAALSADKRQRRSLLVERVQRAKDELKAFDASGGRYTMSREQALAEVRTLIGLMHDIPSDLAKTAQSIRLQTRDTTQEFMSDERPIGEIMGLYLARSRDMFVNTEEGRSFLDAVSVIADPSQSNEIADLLDAIAHAPAFEGAEWEQRQRLGDAWTQVSQGIDRVLEAKNRATNVISHAVAQFDNTDQRALSRALKQLDNLAHQWAANSSHNDVLTADTSTGNTVIHPLITREANLALPQPPARLSKHSNDGQEVDLARLFKEGGPQTRVMLGHVRAHPVRTEDGRISVASSFNALPEELRRSSEVVGFLQRLPVPREGDKLVRWSCVDTDGFALSWLGADITLTEEQLESVEEELEHA